MNNFRLDFAVLMLLVSCGFGFSQTASPKPTNVAQTISLDELKIADSLIEKADAAYYAKKFDEAALLYAQAASMPPVAYTKDSIYYNAACSAALAAKPDDAMANYQAAVYYMENGKDLKQALEMMNKGTAKDPQFWQMHQKAKLQAMLKDKKGAMESANKSIELAKKANNNDYVRLNEELLAELKK